MNNPYEAPKSDVRDVEPRRLLAQRPRQVVHATLLFWMSFVASLPIVYSDFRNNPQDPGATAFAVAFLALVVAVIAVVNVAMWRGRNWARIIFLMLSVFSVVTFVEEIRETLESSMIEIALTVVSTGMDVAVSYFLFTKPGSLWFRTAQ